MEYVVYILYSKRHDKIYIGFTSDLINRIRSHNFLSKKGWTIKYRPWEVIFCEFYKEKSLAMKREEKLKGAKSRDKIREKIISEYQIVGFISA
jgi:putative endonuclease